MSTKDQPAEKIENTQKIVEAAGAIAASINAKYEAARKELEVVKIALARAKEEHATTKKELDSLKTELGSKRVTE